MSQTIRCMSHGQKEGLWSTTPEQQCSFKNMKEGQRETERLFVERAGSALALSFMVTETLTIHRLIFRIPLKKGLH